MIIFFRNGNKNIAEIELFGSVENNTFDLYSSIYITEYSTFLLNLPDDVDKNMFIKIIEEIDEIRLWYYESYRYTHKNYNIHDIYNDIVKKFKSFAKTYNLKIVED